MNIQFNLVIDIQLMNGKIQNLLIVQIVILLSFTNCSSIYNLFKHPQDTNAKCIDGSPSALYIYEGETDKILLYFEGGGMCFGSSLSDTI